MKVAELTEADILTLAKSFATVGFLQERWESACKLVHQDQWGDDSPQEIVHKIIFVIKEKDDEFNLFWKVQDLLGDERTVDNDKRSWLVGLEEHLTDMLKGLSDVTALLGRLIDGLLGKVRETFKDAEIKHHRNHRPGLPTYLFAQGDKIFHFKFNDDSLDLDFPHGPVAISYKTLDPKDVIEKIGRFVYDL